MFRFFDFSFFFSIFDFLGADRVFWVDLSSIYSILKFRLLFIIPPAPVAGWFRMVDCSLPLPSFPRGGVYPTPAAKSTPLAWKISLIDRRVFRMCVRSYVLAVE